MSRVDEILGSWDRPSEFGGGIHLKYLGVWRRVREYDGKHYVVVNGCRREVSKTATGWKFK